MAVYKSVKGVGKTKSSLYNILKYVGSQNEKKKMIEFIKLLV